MRKPYSLLLPTGLVWLAGCQSVDLRISSIGAPLLGYEREPVFIDLSQTHIEDRAAFLDIDPYEWIETRNPLRLDVDSHGVRKKPCYSAVLLPALQRNALVRAQVRTSDPVVELAEGSAFFWRRHPKVMTKHVLVAGYGTVMAVEIVSPERLRVYLSSSNPPTARVDVICRHDESVKGTLDKPGTFLVVETKCEIGASRQINANTEASAFMRMAEAAARAAGWKPGEDQ